MRCGVHCMRSRVRLPVMVFAWEADKKTMMEIFGIGRLMDGSHSQ